ncbi:hypothetical protein Tco_1056014 [Tanacetum coccineum]|uniref:Secreted protein n=1 Tax=Tanacetum coccineum TaxID=301880 RepID=A0ABQ5H329_9ASTR
MSKAERDHLRGCLTCVFLIWTSSDLPHCFHSPNVRQFPGTTCPYDDASLVAPRFPFRGTSSDLPHCLHSPNVRQFPGTTCPYDDALLVAHRFPFRGNSGGGTLATGDGLREPPISMLSLFGACSGGWHLGFGSK